MKLTILSTVCWSRQQDRKEGRYERQPGHKYWKRKPIRIQHDHQITPFDGTLPTCTTGAYPEEAGVESWVRRVTLNRGRSVEIPERYRLEALRRPFTLTLMTALEPALPEPGRITLKRGPFQ